MAVVVVGAVVTVGDSEEAMVVVIVRHQLLLQFKTNPSSRRLVGSEAHLLPENILCCLKTQYQPCCVKFELSLSADYCATANQT